ncbi:MAG: hypothetical protein HOP26_04380 [Methylotenera sp.]|nr:hypothetical protein [Methylotenera sp.]
MAGRKPNTEIERLKQKYWYWYIKSRTDLNDPQLDILFAEDESGRKYTYADRPRMFESIRERGTTPSDGSHRLRKFNLIDKVENHPSFHGSKKIYTSPFWDLLQSNPFDLDKNNEILETSLKKLNLVRINPEHEHFWDFIDVPFNQNKERNISPDDICDSDYEDIFNKTIFHFTNKLDLLALIGALYRESCLTFQLENAMCLSDYFRVVSDTCLNTEWKNPAGALILEIAHERIIYGNYKYETSMRNKSNIYKDNPKSLGLIVNKSDSRFIDIFGSNQE